MMLVVTVVTFILFVKIETNDSTIRNLDAVPEFSIKIDSIFNPRYGHTLFGYGVKKISDTKSYFNLVYLLVVNIFLP